MHVSERDSDAVNALLQYNRAKTQRRIALSTKQRDKATSVAQFKLNCLLHDFIGENVLEYGDVARTFPEKVSFKFGPEEGNFEHDSDYENADAAEGFDFLDFNEKDELEYMFDEPNVAAGAYDRDEVDYFVDQKIHAALKTKRKSGFSDGDVNELLASNRACDERELEERIEEARARLIRKRKLLPPLVSKAKHVTVKTVVVKQVAAKRSFPSENPSVCSCTRAQALPVRQPTGEEAGAPSPETAEACGDSSRSGRAVKRPRRFE